MKCNACKGPVERSERLKCTLCNGMYHHKCIDSEANLDQLRKSWKCPLCLNAESRRQGNDETPIRPTQAKINVMMKSCDEAVDDPSTSGGHRSRIAPSVDTISYENFAKLLDAKLLSQTQNLEATIKSEIKTAIDGLKSEFTQTTDHLSNEIERIDSKCKEFESRFSKGDDRLFVVENNIAVVKKLQSDLSIMNAAISELQEDNGTRDQFFRMNNLEISGVPVTSGENLNTIVHSISSKVGVVLEVNDIDSIHRVRRFVKEATGDTRDRQPGLLTPRPPAIIVRFTRRLCKDQLLAAVRGRRGLTTTDIGLPGPSMNLYVSDHLTPANKLLLKRARELKTELQYSFLWVRDCKIFMRKNERSKVINIRKNSDLLKLN